LAAAQAAEAAETAAPAEGDFVLDTGLSEETIQEAAADESAAQVAVTEAVPAEAPPPPPPPPATADEIPSGTGETRSYSVHRYETLSDIAARADVYGEADLWPILFDANRDLIRDPDRLPRVTIRIPLDVSDADKASARERARSHTFNLWDGE